MLAISQKRFFVSLDELALFVEPDIKQSVIAWAFAGWKNTHLAPMEIGIKNQIFLEKPEVGVLNSD